MFLNLLLRACIGIVLQPYGSIDGVPSFYTDFFSNGHLVFVVESFGFLFNEETVCGQS